MPHQDTDAANSGKTGPASKVREDEVKQISAKSAQAIAQERPEEFGTATYQEFAKGEAGDSGSK